jgi:hypothetical protein
MIRVEPLRTLTLRQPSRAGRPAHVSAASGLVRAGGHFYVVADDENHLGIFPASGTPPGSLVRILAGQLPLGAKARKRKKADLESVVCLPPFRGREHGALLLLGSGSKRKRCSGVLLGLDARGQLDGTAIEIDLAPLYGKLDDRIGSLNIEGAVALGEELVLLQRGNKGACLNARVRLRLVDAIASLAERSRLGIELLVGLDEVDLGKVGAVPLGFSDGSALPDGRMVFTAIAEDTSDSYLDGACHGAAVGVLDRNGRLERLEMIDPCYKVEGVEASLESGAIRLFLVTDADDAHIAASLLRGSLPEGSP